MSDGAAGAHVRRLIEMLDVGTVSAQRRDWTRVEAELRTRLPGDYKEFIEQVGGGRVDGYLSILAPSCPNRNFDLAELVAEREEAYADLFEFEDKPVQLAPEESRLIAWGTTDNGEWLFWRALPNQDPSEFPVLVNEARGDHWEFHEMGFGEYLTSVLEGEIKSSILSDVWFPTSPHTFRPFTHTP